MFQYISDIHLEYLTYIPFIKKTADNLFLVGDIGHPGTFLFDKFIKKCSELYKNVFFVYGNHEYYSVLRGKRKKIETMQQRIDYAKNFPSNVYFLNNSCVYFNKHTQTVKLQLTDSENINDYIKIIGSTLWSNRGQNANNFKNIYMSEGQLLTFEHQSRLYESSRLYLISELYRENMQSIILTHYTTHLCANGSYLDNKDTNHIRELFLNKNLIACINGHTHSSINTIVPGTNIKLLANCFGYKAESQEIVKYNENAVLDINQESKISFAGLYSKSEINPVEILYKVMHRPNPVYDIGQVEQSTPFVVSTVGKDNTIVYVNRAFEELTGYSLNEVRGKNCRFLQSPNGEVQKGSTREHCDNQLLFNVKSKLSKMEECQFITYNFTKTGERFKNLITIIPITFNTINYYVGFQCDITYDIFKFDIDKINTSIIDNNILEKMLSYNNGDGNINIDIDDSTDTASISFSVSMSIETNDDYDNKFKQIRYKHFFDDNPSILCIINKDGVFKKMNSTFLKLLGYNKLDMYNKLLLNFVYHEDIDKTVKEADKIEELKTIQITNRYIKKDGSLVSINWISKLKDNFIYCIGTINKSFTM